jgi:RNA polymerase sigma-70 factor (ECF subfamily)
VGDVGVEVVQGHVHVLAVEAGRQSVLAGGAAHVEESFGGPGWFPGHGPAFLGRAPRTTLALVEGLTWLASRAATGDRAALGSFVAQSQADVWRLCAHLVEPSSADDLTQEVYLRALPALTSFRADASARSWLLAIARNTCMDELRRRTRGRALVERLRRRAETVPPVEPDRSGLVEIDEAVRSLDPDRRDAFVLTQVLGLSYREAAEVCGCEIGTIRSRVARARGQLIERLVDDGRPETGSGSVSR